MWTIVHNGTEDSFEALGISETDIVRHRESFASDVLSLRVAGQMEAELLFGFGEDVVVYRDRISGSEGYSGGTIFFRGRARLPRRSGGGKGESVGYDIAGPWWDFERLVMQQEWNEFAGWTVPADPNSDPMFVQRRSSELFLGQTCEGARLTTGQQIAEAVNWAITCGVPVQLGTIDPAAQIPVYNTRDITVAEVIRQMVEWTPDAIGFFDYATVPPTFHIRKPENLPVVEIEAPETPTSAVDLVPRYDLQLPAVCLRFKKTNSVDGRPSVVITNQNAPLTATGMELGASVHTVELMGSSATNVYGELECAACQAANAGEAIRIAWWQGKDPKLLSEYMDPNSIHVSVGVVVGEDGAPVNLGTYPNELLNGQIAAWMKVGGNAVIETKATVKALLEYDQYRVPVKREGGVLKAWVSGAWTTTNVDRFLQKGRRSEALHANIRLTNGVSGTYSVLGSFAAGETEPAGLAAEIYASHATLRYEGQIVFLGQEVPANLSMGNVVNLTTVFDGAEYNAWNGLLVQSISEDLGAGRMAVRFGPAAQRGIVDLMAQLRVNRYRLVYNNPATRVSSTVSNGGDVSLGKATARENTTSGLSNADWYGISAPAAENQTTVTGLDAKNKAIVLEVQNANGSRDTASGSVDIKLADAGGKAIKIVEITVCDPATSTQKKMRVVACDPY